MPGTTPEPMLVGRAGRFDDPDAFAAALVGGSFEYMPLPGQRFSAMLRVLALGSLVVQQADDSPHVARGALAAGTVGLIVPLRNRGAPPRMNGAEIAGTEAFMVPSAVEFYSCCPGPQDWAALALPATLIEEWTELAPLPLRLVGAASVLALAPEPAARLGAALASAARMAEAMPEVLAAPGCAQGLAHALRDLVETSLAAGTEAPRPRATREAMRVVAAAEEFLRAHLGRPIYRDEVCAALHVSRRKLHDAFVATVGMSPHTYLKLRRLVLARRALRAADGTPALVKSVALAHGFWHLGYFAQDYRALFGEAPSATRAAVIGEGGRWRPGRTAPHRLLAHSG